MVDFLIGIIIVCIIVGIGAIILRNVKSAREINEHDEQWREARHQNIMNKYKKLVE